MVARQLTLALYSQRFVSISAHSANDPSPIIIRDFNAHSVARYSESEWNEKAYNHSSAGIKSLVTHATLLEPRDVFTEHVWSALPYTEAVSRQRYDYTAVLMDEESILGLRVRIFLPLFY